MIYCLGIDGGGSGCRAAVADATGRLVGRGQAGPANVNTNPDGTRANIMAATTAALAGTGIAAESLTAVLGLAGANVSAAARRLADSLPFAQTRIVTDATTAAHGALGEADGIMAAIGTGSVFVRRRAGQMRQFGGRGFLLGDEGSGAVLGRALLTRALRADDGFAPMTPLLDAVLADMGGAEGIIAFASRAAPADFAALAPRIIGADDPAADSVLDAGVADVWVILSTLQEGGAPLPVVFTGGLGGVYAARLARDWPQRTAQGTGLDGALAMARDMALSTERAG